MDILKALEKISKVESVNDFSISALAKKALLNYDDLVSLVQYVTDQFDDGNGHVMAAKYGFEEINTVLDYAGVINARAEYKLQEIQALEEILNNPINLN